MSVEHVGHVSAAVDRRTSSTPSRAARAASAPTDDVQLVAALVAVLVAARRGARRRRGAAPRFFRALRRRLSSRRLRAIHPASILRLLIAARGRGRRQVVAASALLHGQGRLGRSATTLCVTPRPEPRLTYVIPESIKTSAPSLTACAVSPPRASVGAPTATEWSGLCILSAMLRIIVTSLFSCAAQTVTSLLGPRPSSTAGPKGLTHVRYTPPASAQPSPLTSTCSNVYTG